MICISVLYPDEEGAWFDFDYFLGKHLPLNLRVLPPLAGPLPPGKARMETLRGVPGPDGSPPKFLCISQVWVNKVEDFMSVVQSKEAVADLHKYTNIMPTVVFGEAIG
jgi:uncharacterized protein (TIGR02118 family)